MGVRDKLNEALGRNGDEMSEVERGLREQARSANIMADEFKENLHQLELAMEDEGWRRLAASLEYEFTRFGLEMMIRLSRALYLSNPLIKRGINVKTYYTWAQGFSLKAADQRVEDEVVLPTIEDDPNRLELFGQQARILTDVDQQVEGNIFVALFTTGDGDVSVRTIPTEQIKEIITQEGDKRIVTYYRRAWVEDIFDPTTGGVRSEAREVLYPDWCYHPEKKPEHHGSLQVEWDAPIIHQRTGGLKDMRFGIPDPYSVMEWARAYKGFLEDWHSLVKSLSRFAWKLSTKGKKVKKLKERLEQEPDPGTAEEEESLRRRIRTPVGEAFVGKEGDDITAIPKSGVTASADDARPSRLMIAAGFDLPDTFLSGDVDIGNFATSKTLDRPTELGFKNRQTMWADLDQNIFRYCCDAKVRALAPGFTGREIKDPRTGLLVIKPDFDPTVTLNFPPILESDKKANIGAIIAAATLEGKADAEVLPEELTAKMLLEALGVEDVDKVMEELPDEEAEEVTEALNNLREAIERVPINT